MSDEKQKSDVVAIDYAGDFHIEIAPAYVAQNNDEVGARAYFWDREDRDIFIDALSKRDAQATLITELVGALEEAQYALRSASKTISSHLGSTNKHRYKTMQKVDEALTKAKGEG